MIKSYVKYYVILGLLCFFIIFILPRENFNLNLKLKKNDINFSEVNIVSDGFNNSYWNDGNSDYSSITVDNFGNIHVVWSDRTSGIWGGGLSDTEVMYASYTDGVGWSNATILSDGYNDYYWNDDQSIAPDIAVDTSGNVHVVWSDSTSGIWGVGAPDTEIMYINYTDGLGWSNVTLISDDITFWNDDSSIDPSIAVDTSGNIHVVWMDNTDGIWGSDSEIMYVNYTDGLGWSKATVISDGYNNYYWNDDSSGHPSITVDNLGNIHVVWEDFTDGIWGIDIEIMYVNYTNGLGWSNVTIISDGYNDYYWNDDLSWTPNIAIDTSGNIHVIWEDWTDGIWGIDEEIMYVNYTYGIGWSNVTLISDGYNDYYWNDDLSTDPNIVVDPSGKIHAVWEDYTDGIWGTAEAEIMYVNYTNGLGWSNATIISDDETGWNNGYSTNPSIVADTSGNVHVVWDDFTFGSWGNDQEIMHINISFTNDLNYTGNLNPIKTDFPIINTIISIFILSSIALFLFLEGDSEKKTKNFRKKILIYICNLSLTISVISLQIYQINDNAKKGIDEIADDPFIFLFPYFLLILAILILILVSISLVISLQEYKSYLRMRNQEIISHRNLTFERIFENESRQKIINTILSIHAVHFKQLLRECGLQPGQLQWHLKVLLEYKIIKKKKIDNYTIYLPNLRSDTFEKKSLSVKSKIGLDILDEIEQNPGIIQSEIADNLDLGRPNINYYIKKLKYKQLIKTEKEGREIKLFLN